MITALLADIHGNEEALEACLQHAHAQGAERFAFLGDLVGYGASPGAVVDRVADYVGRGALAVAGNHDVAVRSMPPHLHGEAREVIVWTRDALAPAQRDFLAALPLMASDGEATFVHATVDAPGQWRYADSAQAARDSLEASRTAYTFCGHVHTQLLYVRAPSGRASPFHPRSGSAVPVPSHHRWLAVAGSAGQPRDGNPAAAYALFDARRELLTFFRIPYDVERAAARIRAAGLPTWLADRLGRGV